MFDIVLIKKGQKRPVPNPCRDLVFRSMTIGLDLVRWLQNQSLLRHMRFEGFHCEIFLKEQQSKLSLKTSKTIKKLFVQQCLFITRCVEVNLRASRLISGRTLSPSPSGDPYGLLVRYLLIACKTLTCLDCSGQLLEWIPPHVQPGDNRFFFL